jgi:hypothetical protein
LDPGVITSSSTESQAALLEGHKAHAPENDVIQAVNIQEFSGFNHGSSHGHIFGAGAGVAGRMIVTQDDRRRIGSDRIAEELAHPDE